MEMRKGFYFSMDAVVALVIMSAALTLVIQLSNSATGEFQTDSSRYAEATDRGKDIIKIASAEKLSSLEQSQTPELTPTVDPSKFNGSVLDAVNLLWETNNKTKASDLVKMYFTPMVPKDYEYKVILEGNEVVYRSSTLEDPPQIVTSSTTLTYVPERPETVDPKNIRLVMWREK
ncbi:hypothetical protein AQV86_02010 [Nanohaloarchaea archaeon SG9]|nr:hypothetical protein AQV86_02010 [Nanohaloarchaea archaeon SG9]